MLRKLAYTQKVLRALAGEKQAFVAPLVIGAGTVASVQAAKKGLKKGRDFKSGFEPGYIETQVEV